VVALRGALPGGDHSVVVKQVPTAKSDHSVVDPRGVGHRGVTTQWSCLARDDRVVTTEWSIFERGLPASDH
jgi:hypothetical protein